MKHFVKRSILDSYESSRLELVNSWEWTYLRSGIDDLISKSDKRIKFLSDSIKDFTEPLKIVHGSVDKLENELDEELKKLEFLKKMLNDLEVENEIKI